MPPQVSSSPSKAELIAETNKLRLLLKDVEKTRKSNDAKLEAEWKSVQKEKAQLTQGQKDLSGRATTASKLEAKVAAERRALEAERNNLQMEQNMHTNDEIEQRLASLDRMDTLVQAKEADCTEKFQELEGMRRQLADLKSDLDSREAAFKLNEQRCKEASEALDERDRRLKAAEQDLNSRSNLIQREAQELSSREAKIHEETFTAATGTVLKKKRKADTTEASNPSKPDTGGAAVSETPATSSEHPSVSSMAVADPLSSAAGAAPAAGDEAAQNMEDKDETVLDQDETALDQDETALDKHETALDTSNEDGDREDEESVWSQSQHLVMDMHRKGS